MAEPSGDRRGAHATPHGTQNSISRRSKRLRRLTVQQKCCAKSHLGIAQVREGIRSKNGQKVRDVTDGNREPGGNKKRVNEQDEGKNINTVRRYRNVAGFLAHLGRFLESQAFEMLRSPAL